MYTLTQLGCVVYKQEKNLSLISLIEYRIKIDPRLSLTPISNCQLLKVKSQEKNKFWSATGVHYRSLIISVHVNDLHQQIEKSHIVMYADDAVLLFSDKNEAEI